MVIVSNLYDVAFKIYSPFSTEMLKHVSSGIYRYEDPTTSFKLYRAVSSVRGLLKRATFESTPKYT